MKLKEMLMSSLTLGLLIDATGSITQKDLIMYILILHDVDDLLINMTLCMRKVDSLDLAMLRVIELLIHSLPKISIHVLNQFLFDILSIQLLINGLNVVLKQKMTSKSIRYTMQLHRL